MTQELTPFAKGFLQGCDARGMSFDEMQKTAEHASQNIPGVSGELACIGHMTKEANIFGALARKVIPSLGRSAVRNADDLAFRLPGLGRSVASNADDLAKPGVLRRLFSNPATTPVTPGAGWMGRQGDKLQRVLSNIPGARSPATAPFKGGAGGYLTGAGIDYGTKEISDSLNMGADGTGYDPGLRNILGLFGAGRSMVPRNLSSALRTEAAKGLKNRPTLQKYLTRPSTATDAVSYTAKEFGLSPGVRRTLGSGIIGTDLYAAGLSGPNRNVASLTDTNSELEGLLDQKITGLEEQQQQQPSPVDQQQPSPVDGLMPGDSSTLPDSGTREEHERIQNALNDPRVRPEDVGKNREQILTDQYGPDKIKGTADDPGYQPPAVNTPSPPTNAPNTGTGGRWWESLKGKFDSLGTKGQFLLALGAMGVLGGGVMAGRGKTGLGLGASGIGGLLIADLMGAFGKPGQYTSQIAKMLGFDLGIGGGADAPTSQAEGEDRLDTRGTGTGGRDRIPGDIGYGPEGPPIEQQDPNYEPPGYVNPNTPQGPEDYVNNDPNVPDRLHPDDDPAVIADDSTAPATAASMFTDGVIDKDESNKILSTPKLRAEVLNMPSEQGVAMLESAIKSDDKLKERIVSMKNEEKVEVMKVLTGEKGEKNIKVTWGIFSDMKDGQGLSPEEAEKFYALAQQVRV